MIFNHFDPSSETQAQLDSGDEEKVKTGGEKLGKEKWGQIFSARFDFFPPIHSCLPLCLRGLFDLKFLTNYNISTHSYNNIIPLLTLLDSSTGKGTTLDLDRRSSKNDP